MRPLVVANCAWAQRRFHAACARPDLAYRRLWAQMRRARADNTPLAADWREHAPTEWEDYTSMMARSWESGVNVATGEPIRFWSTSSGTTGARKAFPLTAGFQAQMQRTIGPFLARLLRAYPQFLRRPMLYLASARPDERAPHGIEVGGISGYTYRNLPAVMRRHYALPTQIVQDGATLKMWTSLYALATDLSAMFAITPLNCDAFLRDVRRHFERDLRMLRDGRGWPSTLPAPRITQARLAALQRLDPETATCKDIWPGLQFAAMWKSSVCAVQLRALSPRLGVPVVDAPYSASEGWMTVPRAHGKGGTLHPGAHVVEFLPFGETPSAAALLQPWELETGREYEIFLTTAMGLIRYRLHDVVGVTGWEGRSPVLEFLRKTASVSLGLVSVTEMELVQASERSDVALGNGWRFGPAPKGQGIALYVPPDAQLNAQQVCKLHEALCEINALYAHYTGSEHMAPMALHRLETALDEPPAHAQTKPSYLLQTCPL